MSNIEWAISLNQSSITFGHLILILAFINAIFFNVYFSYNSIKLMSAFFPLSIDNLISWNFMSIINLFILINVVRALLASLLNTFNESIVNGSHHLKFLPHFQSLSLNFRGLFQHSIYILNSWHIFFYFFYNLRFLIKKIFIFF